MKPTAQQINGTAKRTAAAFTLIEIAICLGIIGFALVAIIGILPAGLQVQRDNREDTIINQEGTFLMEAIRNGAEELGGTVRLIEIRSINNPQSIKRTLTDVPGDDAISFLSRPSDFNVTENDPVEVRAIIRPTSGSPVDSGSEVGMEYQLVVRNFAFTNASPDLDPLLTLQMSGHLREVRLEFRWPVLPNGKVGSGRQVFRSLISGRLQPDHRVVVNNNVTDQDRWLFKQ